MAEWSRSPFVRGVERQRRRRQAGVIPTIPIFSAPEIASQPRVNPQPAPAPAATPGPHSASTGSEFNLFSHVQNLLAQSKEKFAQNAAAREAALQSQQGASQAASRQNELAHKMAMDQLVDQFAPDRAEATTVQALAMNPKFQDLPPSELYRIAREEEGRRNAQEFGRRLDQMTPQERATLSPLAAGLHKEDLDPHTFQAIVDAAKRNDGSAYEFRADQRRKANRILRSTIANLDPEHGSLSSEMPLIPEDPGEKWPAREGDPDQDLFTPWAGARSSAVKGLKDVASGVGGLVKDTLTVTETPHPLDNLEKIFRGEQEIVTPITRPVVNTLLKDLGVSDGPRHWVDRNVTPFLVPSSFMSFGDAEGLSLVRRLGGRFLLGGALNLQQDIAARQVRGEDPPDQLEKITTFVFGGAAEAGMPEMGSIIFKVLRKAHGAMFGRDLAEVGGEAAQEGEQAVTTALARNAPAEGGEVIHPPTTDRLAAPQVGGMTDELAAEAGARGRPYDLGGRAEGDTDNLRLLEPEAEPQGLLPPGPEGPRLLPSGTAREERIGALAVRVSDAAHDLSLARSAESRGVRETALEEARAALKAAEDSLPEKLTEETGTRPLWAKGMDREPDVGDVEELADELSKLARDAGKTRVPNRIRRYGELIQATRESLVEAAGRLEKSQLEASGVGQEAGAAQRALDTREQLTGEVAAAVKAAGEAPPESATAPQGGLGPLGQDILRRVADKRRKLPSVDELRAAAKENKIRWRADRDGAMGLIEKLKEKQAAAEVVERPPSPPAPPAAEALPLTAADLQGLSGEQVDALLASRGLGWTEIEALQQQVQQSVPEHVWQSLEARAPKMGTSVALGEGNDGIVVGLERVIDSKMQPMLNVQAEVNMIDDSGRMVTVRRHAINPVRLPESPVRAPPAEAALPDEAIPVPEGEAEVPVLHVPTGDNWEYTPRSEGQLPLHNELDGIAKVTTRDGTGLTFSVWREHPDTVEISIARTEGKPRVKGMVNALEAVREMARMNPDKKFKAHVVNKDLEGLLQRLGAEQDEAGAFIISADDLLRARKDVTRAKGKATRVTSAESVADEAEGGIHSPVGDGDTPPPEPPPPVGKRTEDGGTAEVSPDDPLPDSFDEAASIKGMGTAARGRRQTIETGRSKASFANNVIAHLYKAAGLKPEALQAVNGDLAKVGILTAKKEGESTNFLDVLESLGYDDLEKYDWASDKQRAAFLEMADRWDEIMEPMTAALVKSGKLSEDVTDKRWVRRIVLQVDGDRVAVRMRGGIGAKQGFQFARQRTTAGIDDRVRYAYDLPSVIEQTVNETYRVIADHEFAQAVLPDKVRFAMDAEHLQQAARAFDDLGLHAEAERLRGLDAPIHGIPTTPEKMRKAVASAYSKKGTAKRAVDRATGRLKEATTRLNAARSQGNARAEKAALKRVERVQGILDEAKGRLEEHTAAHETARAASADWRVKYAHPGPGESRITQPFAGSYVASDAWQEAFQKSIYATPGLPTYLAQAVSPLNRVLKALWATFDLSYMGLQTLPGLFVNPAGWAHMMGLSSMSLFWPDKYNGYIARKFADGTLDEMVDKGGIAFFGADFTVDELVRSMLADPKVSRIDRINFWAHQKGPFKIGNDSWNRALNVMSIHLWEQGKALAEGDASLFSKALNGVFGSVPGIKSGRGWEEQLGAAISHMTGRLSIPESSAMKPTTNLWVGALPFAGRYWAAWGKLIAGMAQGGLEGATARKAVASWLASGVGIYSAAAYATGQDTHLDPRDSKNFLTLKLGGTKVGFGGPLQQLMVTAGKIANDPKKTPQILGTFARGKSSPIVAILTDLATRETFTHQPVNWQAALGEVMKGEYGPNAKDMTSYIVGHAAPFSLQDIGSGLTRDITEGKGIDEITSNLYKEVKTLPGQELGLRSFPESPFEARDDIAKDKYGRSYRDLLPAEQHEVDKSLPPTVTRPIEDRREEGLRVVGDNPDAAYQMSREAGEGFQKKLQQAADQVSSGDLTHAQYRELVDDLGSQQRAVSDAVLKNVDRSGGGHGDSQTAKDLEGYSAIFDRYPNADVDPDQKDQMFADLDTFRESLGPEREAALDANLGVSKQDIPLVKELRNDRRAIRQSNYWDLQDKAWAAIVRTHPGLPADRLEYIKQLIAKYRANQPRFNSLPPEAVMPFISNNGILKVYNNVLSREKKGWMRQHPEETGLLIKWGYVTSQTGLNTATEGGGGTYDSLYPGWPTGK